jgi:hypothetical protein
VKFTLVSLPGLHDTTNNGHLVLPEKIRLSSQSDQVAVPRQSSHRATEPSPDVNAKLRTARLVLMGMGYCNKSIMLGRGPAPGVELRVIFHVVRRRLGDEFREPAESELSAGVTSPPVSGVRGLPLTPDDFLR